MLEKKEVDYHSYVKNLDDERLGQLRWAVFIFDGFMIVISSFFLCWAIGCLYSSFTEGRSLGIALSIIDISLVFAFIYFVKGIFVNENYQEIKGEMRNRGLIPIV